MTNEIKNQVENINSLNELAELLNDWCEDTIEEDANELIEYAAECNCDWYVTSDNEWDCMTDGVHVLYMREDGKFDTFIVDYNKEEERIASIIKGGVVFTTNADPAHTCDYPAMMSALLYWLHRYELIVISSDDDTYADARERLDLGADYEDPIYNINGALFARA